ncbi:MAG: DNA mismatch repair endonuclease MutL [Alphaproteobacteria bacterium]|nr:DNA mismatch repair endonuclease MutL [Alphaproteobacteria bacterium]OJV45769.1 MAG: DNA mismatch repair protein MutL [Alphaproteobacteria bacterium 43-37]
MTIRLLPSTLVNRIAAGEVIERPASVVKELVENAIDAGATHIDVTVENGGINRITVSDNGLGMTAEDLELSIERHATSKLVGEDLLNISYLGFRGEALPSIASISRFLIQSRHKDGDSGWKLLIEAGRKNGLQPTFMTTGTRVEVKDLFYATPARLKFLKTPTTELGQIVGTLERLAISTPHIRLTLTTEKRKVLDFAAHTGDLFEQRLNRLVEILGKDFAANALPIDETREGIRVSGYISLPTFNKSNSQHQYFFVNGRPVKDRLLLGAIRGAYMDVLAHDRYAVVVLAIDLPCDEVDVNVHPTKAEVRFKDNALVRHLCVGSIKRALANAGHKAASTVSHRIIPHMSGATRPLFHTANTHAYTTMPQAAANVFVRESTPAFQLSQNNHYQPQPVGVDNPQAEDTNHFPLGLARAQIHNTYIIAQSSEGMVIVDQHAAHERIVYERLKSEFAQNIERETLLIPEVVGLTPKHFALLQDHIQTFHNVGLHIENFGDGAILVREVPTLIKGTYIQELIVEICEDISLENSVTRVEEALLKRLSTHACHHSIRAGKPLSHAEMDTLLRQMESTPLSGQCNHGRPTHVVLSLSDIERLFGRK